MFTFKDGNDRVWDLTIDLGIANKLRKNDINLLNVEVINKYLSDPIDLFNLMYLVCERQAEVYEMDDEAFGSAIGGKDASGNYIGQIAADLFVEALGSFFTMAGRTALTAMVKRVWEASKKNQSQSQDLMYGAKTTKVINKLMSDAMKEANQKLDDLLGETSGK